MSYLQNFNFAWGVGVFSGEERSRSDDFWEGSGTPRDGGEEKLKHDGVRIFQFPVWHQGFQLILLVIFKKEHGCFRLSMCESLDKSKCSRCFNLLLQMTRITCSSGQQRLYHAVQRPVKKWCSPFSLLKGPKTRKALKYLPFCIALTTTGGQVTCFVNLCSVVPLLPVKSGQLSL